MANTIQKESKIVYLQIGQNYEHLAETKQFDVSEWVSEFPDATIYMLFKRPGEEAVAPVQTTFEDGILTWTISNWETGILGVGFAEIRAIDSSTGMVKKSHVIPCSIEASVTDEDAAPDYPSWVDRMLRYGENVESIYEGLTDAITEGKADIEQVASDTLSETTDALDDKAAAVLAKIPPTYTEVLEGIAKQYDPTAYYNKYEYVWHDGKIYLRLNNSSSPVGAWNPDDWSTPTNFATSMFELRYDMDWEKKLWDAMKAALYKDYVGYYDSQSPYNAGDVVWKDNANTAPIGFYRAKVDITPSSTYFVPANWDQLLGFDEQITNLKSAIDNVSHRDLLQENAQNEVHVKDESRLAQLENQLDETAIKVDNNSLQIADLVDDLTDTKVKILVNKPGNAYFVNSLGYAFVGNTYTLSDEIRDEFLSQASVPVIIHEASASQVYAANSRKITNLETKQSEAAKNAENNTLRIDDLVQDLTKFKASKCVGNSSVYLADGYGRILARNVYALSDDITADMLESVNKSGYLGVYSRFAFDDWEIPVLRLDGVIPALLAKTANKSIEQSVSAGDPPILYTFMGRSGTIDKMKVQGSSSVKFPKKNYTLTFHDSMVIVDGWERSKKYVVKSNLNDCSQARNACCAKLWGDIAKTRSAAQANDLLIDENENYLVNSVGACLLGIALPPYNIGGNYGAIDGFPILVSINGQYWGLYSFNVPKDKYMASMDGNGTECIVSCGGYSTTNAEYFKGQATMEPDANAVTDFEVEYSHDLTDADVLTSINQAISATMATYDTPQERIETINQYVDINSAMDYFILTALINNTDGVGKNYLLDTWDGVKWYFVPYDMDMVLGNDKWAGTKVGAPTDGLTFSYLASLHRLFYVIYHYDRENFISRYKALRAGALSESNIYKVFGSFVNNIPMAAYDYEGIRWPETPGTSIKTFDQIVNWYRLRCQYLDAEIAALEGTA